MYQWSINEVGPRDTVVATIEGMGMPRCLTDEPKSIVKKAAAGVVVQSKVEMVPTEHHPSEEDFTDFERIRKMILVELDDVRTPYAGVHASYVENPPHQGGYSLRLGVSAYESLGDAMADAAPDAGATSVAQVA